MSKVLEQRSLGLYGGRIENYLNDWARRAGHLDDFNDYVALVDGWGMGVIVRKEDAEFVQKALDKMPEMHGQTPYPTIDEAFAEVEKGDEADEKPAPKHKRK